MDHETALKHCNFDRDAYAMVYCYFAHDDHDDHDDHKDIVEDDDGLSVHYLPLSHSNTHLKIENKECIQQLNKQKQKIHWIASGVNTKFMMSLF